MGGQWGGHLQGKGGQALRRLMSFKTFLKPLKTRIIKSTIYLHEGEVYGGVSLFPLGERSKFFFTSEWKMMHFGAFWVLFLQTAVT